jgi:hypothetical protein
VLCCSRVKLGHSHWLQGQIVAGWEHLEQTLALHDPEAGRPLSPLLQADPSVIGQAQQGLVLWLLGYPGRGRGSLQQALARAQAIEQPPSAALAHLVAGIVHLLLDRDVAAALSHAATLRPLGGAGLEYDVWAKLLAGRTLSPSPSPRGRGERDLAEAKALLEELE